MSADILSNYPYLLFLQKKAQFY